MARIRTIKPDFFTDSKVLRLSPCARLLFIALWCEADREGRFKWEPETHGYRYMPKDHADIAGMFAELLDNGFLERYDVDGKEYAYIQGFIKHQVINAREGDSELPEPPNCLAKSSRDDAKSSRAHEARRKGREGKGRECASTTQWFDEEFWPRYPRKVSKGQATKAIQALKPDEQLRADILSGLERAMTQDSRFADPKFTPHPATWIRAEGWTDEGGGADPFAGAL